MKKRTGIFVLFAALFMMLAGTVMATTTFTCAVVWPNTTSQAMNLSTGYAYVMAELNSTNDSATGGELVDGVNWSATPVGGSEIIIASNNTDLNLTANVNEDNISKTTMGYAAASSLYDSTTYTITATVYNQSSVAKTTCSQTYTRFDKTKPTVTFTPASKAQIESPTTIAITAKNASMCTFAVASSPSGSFSKEWNATRIVTTLGAETYNWEIDGVASLADGFYNFRVACTDTGGSNTTTVTNTQIEVYESPSGMRGAMIEEDIAAEKAAKEPIKALLIIGGLVFFGWLATKKK